MTTTKQYRVKFSDQVDRQKFTNSSVNNNNNNNNSVYDYNNNNSNNNDNSVLINNNNNSRTNNANSTTTLKITQNNNNNKNGDYNNNVSCLHYSDNDYNKVKTIQIQKPQPQQQQQQQHQQQPKVTSTYQQSTYIHQPPFAVIDRVADVPVIRSTVNALYPDSDFDVVQAKPLSAKCDNRQRSYSNDALDNTVYLKIDTSNNNTSSKPFKSNTNLEKEEVVSGNTFQISGIIPLKRPKQQQQVQQQPQNYNSGTSTIITNNNNNNGYLKDQTTATYSSSYQTNNNKKKSNNNYESTLYIDESDMSSNGYNIPIYKTSTVSTKPDFSNGSNTYNYSSNSNNNGTEIKINTYNSTNTLNKQHINNNANYNNNNNNTNYYNYTSSNVYGSSGNNNNNKNNYEEHFIEIPIIRISECKTKPFEYNSSSAQIQPVKHCVSIPVIYETKK